MKRIDYRSHCPINFGLEVFGDKWSLLIVRDIVFAQKQTYGDFLKSEEGIATNILAARLALLEREGILTTIPDPSDKRKESYVLTDKGLDLLPILLQIEAWSSKHDPKTDASQELVTQIENDAKEVCSNLRDIVRARQDALRLAAKTE